MTRKITRKEMLLAGAGLGLAIAGAGSLEIINKLESKNPNPEVPTRKTGVYYQLGTQMPEVDLSQIDQLYGAFSLPNANEEFAYPAQLASLAAAMGNRAASTELYLSLGGWGEYTTAWQSAVANPKRFAKNAERMSNQFHDETGVKLAGFDLDVENIPGGVPVDMINALASAIKSKISDAVVTAAVPASTTGLSGDAKKLSVLDGINIMSYDKAGNWSDFAEDFAPGAGTIADVREYVEAGIDPAIIMAMFPTYGRWFKGAKKPGDGFDNPDGKDNATLYTDIPTVGIDDHEAQMTSWVIDGDHLISFQTPHDVQLTASKLYKLYPTLGRIGFWSDLGLTQAHLDAVA